MVSRTSTSSPSDAPYTAAARPAGPAPTMMTSRTCAGSIASLKPRHSAICSLVGLRSTTSPRQISTGYVGDGDVKPVEQGLDVGVAFEIEVGVRMGVAVQELPDAQRARAMAGTDDDDVAEIVRDQLHPAQDEGAHQDLADLGIGLHQRQHAFAAELDDLPGLADAGAHEGGARGDHVDLAGEIARAVQGDELLGAGEGLGDLDLARGDDKERHVLLAGFDQHLAALRRPPLAVGSHPRDLRRRELGEHALGGGFGRRPNQRYIVVHGSRRIVPMIAEIIGLIETYGLAFVFLNVLVEQGGLPIPAYPVLIVSAGLVSRGDYNMTQLVLVGTAAALLADTAWFWSGRRYGRRLLATLCRISLSPDFCVRQTESIFTRWGPASLLVAKFIPGFASLATALAGTTKIRLLTFLFFDALGAAIWVGVAVALGALFRDAIADVLAVLVALGQWGVVLIASLLLLFVASKWWQRLRFARQLRMDRITVDELQALISGGEAPVILDVRSPESQAEAGIIPGARAVSRSDVEALAATLPTGTDIIVYCNCPNEASAVQLARQLSRLGLKRIRPLLGGVDAWLATGQGLVPYEPPRA